MTIDDLLKAKETIEKKLKLNKSLIETIEIIKKDESILKNENKAYQIALKLIVTDLRKRYKGKSK